MKSLVRSFRGVSSGVNVGVFAGLGEGFDVGDFLDFFGFLGEVIWLARGFAGKESLHYKGV